MRDELSAEARANGAKISENAVIRIGRDPNGTIVWLEEGGVSRASGKSAGLHHILEEHRRQFEQAGVAVDDIPELVHRAITEGRYTGHLQGAPPGRPIYEIEWPGTAASAAAELSPRSTPASQR